MVVDAESATGLSATATRTPRCGQKRRWLRRASAYHNFERDPSEIWKVGDGPPRRDVGPSCGSRSRQPVGRFSQAWNAARDSQPPDLRARITLKDQAPPQVDTADDSY